MEHTCSALNERLATLRSADRSPQRDELRLDWQERERERVERELERRDSALVHATCAAAKASGLAEHYKSQTDELRRRYAQLQARVRDESKHGAPAGRWGADVGGSGTQEPPPFHQTQSAHLPADPAVQTLSCEQERPSDTPHLKLASPPAALSLRTALEAPTPAPMGPGGAASAANFSQPVPCASAAAPLQASPAGGSAAPDAVAAVSSPPSAAVERLMLLLESELAATKATLALREAELAAALRQAAKKDAWWREEAEARSEAEVTARRQARVELDDAIAAVRREAAAQVSAARTAAEEGTRAAVAVAVCAATDTAAATQLELKRRLAEAAAAAAAASERAEALASALAEQRRATEALAVRLGEAQARAIAALTEAHRLGEGGVRARSGAVVWQEEPALAGPVPAAPAGPPDGRAVAVPAPALRCGISAQVPCHGGNQPVGGSSAPVLERADGEPGMGEAVGRFANAVAPAGVGALTPPAPEIVEPQARKGQRAMDSVQPDVVVASPDGNALREAIATVVARAELAEAEARRAQAAAEGERGRVTEAMRAAEMAQQGLRVAGQEAAAAAAELRGQVQAANAAAAAARIEAAEARAAEQAARAAAEAERAVAATARQEADDMMVRAGAAAERALAAISEASARERELLRELQSSREVAALFEATSGGAAAAAAAEAAEAERRRLCERLDAVTDSAARDQAELNAARTRLGQLEASDAAAGVRARETAAALDRERGRVRAMRQRLRELSNDRWRGDSGCLWGEDSGGTGGSVGGGAGSEEVNGARVRGTSALRAVLWESSEEEGESTEWQGSGKEASYSSHPSQQPPSPPSPPAWDTPPALGIRAAGGHGGFVREGGAAVAARSAAQAEAVVEAWAQGSPVPASIGHSCLAGGGRGDRAAARQRETGWGPPCVAASGVRRGASVPREAALPALPAHRAGSHRAGSHRAGSHGASGDTDGRCHEAGAVRAASAEAARRNREEAAAAAERRALGASPVVNEARPDLQMVCEGLRRKASQHLREAEEARVRLASSQREADVLRGKLQACEDRRVAAEARRQEAAAAAAAARGEAGLAQAGLLAAQEELGRLRTSHRALSSKIEFLTSRLRDAVAAQREAALATVEARGVPAQRVESRPVWSRGRAAGGDESSADQDGADSTLLSARAAVHGSADAARECAGGVRGAQGSYILDLERHVRNLERKLARAELSHSPVGPPQREGTSRPAPRITSLGHSSHEGEAEYRFSEHVRRAFLCAPADLSAAPSAAPPLRPDGARPCSPPQANQPLPSAHSPHRGSVSSPTATALRLLHASHAAVRVASQPLYATRGHESSLGLSAGGCAPHSPVAPRPHRHAAAVDVRVGRVHSSPAMWQRHSAAAIPQAGIAADSMPPRWSVSASIERKGSELVRVALAELAAS